MILTVYHTFWQRCLATTSVTGSKERIYGTASGNGKSIEDLDTSRVYTSLIQYEFERVILDEAHALRNPRTLISEMVRQTRKSHIHFLTATPMLNHPRDLRGLLTLFWNPEWALHDVGLGFKECYEKDFDPAGYDVIQGAGGPHEQTLTKDFLPRAGSSERSQQRYATFMEAYKRNEKVWLLDPDNFRVVGTTGKWAPAITALMIPQILAQFQLRLTMASHIDREDGQPAALVAEDVPPCNIYTVELQMAPAEARQYRDVTEVALKAIARGDREGMAARAPTTAFSASANTMGSEGIQDNGIYRLVMQATFDARLPLLTTSQRWANGRALLKGQPVGRNNWVGEDFDHGASFYFVATRYSAEYMVPIDRLSLAVYVSAMSTKMKYALGLLGEWVLEQRLKVILIFEFPMCQW